mmetsp:Transcript_21959/g.54270  ORF Transcript_21959/g.54270 Transcript_21959/m.54270 type:complete len:80 (+) Transcript_21959:70-309(+)
MPMTSSDCLAIRHRGTRPNYFFPAPAARPPPPARGDFPFGVVFACARVEGARKGAARATGGGATIVYPPVAVEGYATTV